jgi:anti-sigma factor RsiW
MNTHENIRKLLPLVAASAPGPALDAAKASSVEGHVAECAECRRELELLRQYARGLQSMPQPAVPEGLLQRTMARVIQERESHAERRKQSVTLGLLGAFSWAMGIVFWLLARAFVTGFGFGAWSVISGALAWTTVGAAAVALRKRNGSEIVRGELYE